MKNSEARQAILEGYFNECMSLAMLSAKYGRSQMQIGRLIREAEAEGWVRQGQTKDRRSTVGADPLSVYHKRVAMQFYRWRDTEMKMTPSQAAEHLGMSKNRYASIEAGIHNWTLLELVFAAEKMGKTVDELISSSDNDARIYQQRVA